MAQDTAPMQGNYHDPRPEKALDQEGQLTAPLDPLALDIDDDELARIVDKRIDDSRHYYETHYNLYDRREKNEQYYLGKQLLDSEKAKLLKQYESRYQDNVLYEIQATMKPLAMSRLPDLIVTPGNESEEATLMAQEISKAVDTDIKRRDNRRVLGIAFKHLPVYFTGIIKVRWDSELDDYLFEVIHPDYIDFDHTATSNNADDMQFVSQIIPMTVEEVLMKFPEKEEEFLQECKATGLYKDDKPDWKALATTVKVREVWFTWYKKHSEHEYERVEGVLWKYKKVILKKMKNPNFDYEGDERFFIPDPTNPEKKRDANIDDAVRLALGIQVPIQSEQVYYNYFDRPRKPFYFMGYDQWGKQPLDETSWLEQNIENQEQHDKRGRQIEETLDNRGHHVFSKESGLTGSDIQNLDMADPDSDILVDGDVNAVHKFIDPERPTPQEFQDLEATRNRMYAISGSQATRGQIQTDVATSNQIARESDFTRADDVVEDTINAAAEWMAQWSLQFIKLRYTKDHFRRILGDAGDVVFQKLNRNMIDDGMIVMIKASGTDKLKAQNNAMDMAKMQMVDPFTFFNDMGLSDPEGRTKKLMLLKTNPQQYMAEVVLGLTTPQAIAEYLSQNPGQNPGVSGMEQSPLQPQMQQGMPQPNPMAQLPPNGVQQAQPQRQSMNPTPQNTGQVPAMPPQNAPNGSVRNL